MPLLFISSGLLQLCCCILIGSGRSVDAWTTTTTTTGATTLFQQPQQHQFSSTRITDDRRSRRIQQRSFGVTVSTNAIKRRGKAGAAEPTKTTTGSLNKSIYSLPALYDLAFGYRDYESEVKFLLQTHLRFVGRPAVTVLELGAGPARHSLAALTMTTATNQDKNNHPQSSTVQRAIAIDQSPEMAAYAKSLAADLHLLDDDASESTTTSTSKKALDYRIGDMRNFQLHPDEPKIDTAWILLGSLQHLCENKDVIRCFQSVHQALEENGTLILELPHPRETFAMTECTRSSWEVPLVTDDVESGQEDAGVLKIIWGDDDDTFDPIRQVRQFTVAMQLVGRNLTPEQLQMQNVREVVPMRLFTTQEIDALAQCANMQVVAMYGALDEEMVAIDDEDEAFRLVCVIQKKQQRPLI